MKNVKKMLKTQKEYFPQVIIYFYKIIYIDIKQQIVKINVYIIRKGETQMTQSLVTFGAVYIYIYIYREFIK